MPEGPSTRAPEALSVRIAATIADALETFRRPRMRGPFPYPSASDLARSTYLRELARWGRAAALRSKKTLGANGVDEALEAASRLECAAELLAAMETAAAAARSGSS